MTERRSSYMAGKMSELELMLAAQLDDAGIAYEREFRALRNSRMRWDFHILGGDGKLLVECNGATWTKGGHSTGRGIERDYRKANLAALSGYRQLTYTRAMIEDGTALREITLAVAEWRAG